MQTRASQRIGIAARAAQRVADKMARVAEMYAPEDSELVLTLEEMHAEMAENGHVYAEDCMSPFCQKARLMLTGALQALAQQQAAAQQQGAVQ